MTRVLSGVTLAAAFFALVWYGNATVLLVVALGVAALAFHEYAELMRRLGAAIPRLPALAVTLTAVAAVPFPVIPIEVVLGLGAAVIAVGAMAGLKARPSSDEARPSDGEARPSVLAVPESQPFRVGASSVLAGGFAAIYLGLPLGALVGVHVYGGRGAVLLLLATIAISDTAQYYAGRLFGRHLLAPRLSPKKTLEGVVGGLVAAPLFLFFAGPDLVPVARPLPAAALGVVLVASGVAGDLFESMIKRAADAKDSGTLIPGHGGVLDRIDALLFATPPFYLYLRWAYAG